MLRYSWMAIASLLLPSPALAQTLPSCPPPEAGEYLVLVMTELDEAETQLRDTLPPNADISRCRYLEESVIRIGGFMASETANAWAQYLADIGGLETVVARAPRDPSGAIAPAVDPSAMAERDPDAAVEIPVDDGEDLEPAPPVGGDLMPSEDSVDPTAVEPLLPDLSGELPNEDLPSDEPSSLGLSGDDLSGDDPSGDDPVSAPPPSSSPASDPPPLPPPTFP